MSHNPSLVTILSWNVILHESFMVKPETLSWYYWDSNILVAWSKNVITPVLMHWSYCTKSSIWILTCFLDWNIILFPLDCCRSYHHTIQSSKNKDIWTRMLLSYPFCSEASIIPYHDDVGNIALWSPHFPKQLVYQFQWRLNNCCPNQWILWMAI